MNRNQFLGLLALVIVLGVAGTMVYRQRHASWSGSAPGVGQKLLGSLPVNDVAAIVIQSRSNQLDLIRKDNLWRVAQRSDYPADYAKLSGFLLKAVDLKTTQIEEVGPSQLGRFDLLPPGQGSNSALLVEFRDQAGKTLASLLLGKEHRRKPARGPGSGEGDEPGWPDGRYVMIPGAKSVAVISDPLGDMDVRADPWLNKDFFKVEKARAIAVSFPDATNSWKLSRETETGDWKLTDAKAGEQLDATKSSSLSYALSSPTFVDVLAMDAREPTGLDQPTVVMLDTFDRFTYTMHIGAKTNDDYYLTVNVAADLPKERAPTAGEKAEDKARLDKEFKDGQAKLLAKLEQEQKCSRWVYLVSTWTVDSILKKRSELLAEKKEEPKKDDARTSDSGIKPEAATK